MMRSEPLTCVGVAGFEPAASSSRSQVAMPTASDAACLTWELPSVSVRWRPLLAVAIVTHLVTRLRAGFGLTTWMQTTGASHHWSGLSSSQGLAMCQGAVLQTATAQVGLWSVTCGDARGLDR